MWIVIRGMPILLPFMFYLMEGDNIIRPNITHDVAYFLGHDMKIYHLYNFSYFLMQHVTKRANLESDN